jgi:hypothetical protein
MTRRYSGRVIESFADAENANAQIRSTRLLISSAAPPGEGEQQQEAPRVDAAQDQVSRPVRQRVGLARAPRRR